MSHERQQIYSRYERVWHWSQAAAILLLMLTGLIIHNPDGVNLLRFSTAVSLHNILGWLLVVNAVLGLFYYITTGTIRQYLPEPREFVSLSIRQLMYYLRGMFRGATHPLEKTPQRRLNPLQQATYLIILNVMLPFQVVTGLLMWSGQQWPDAIAALGGLPRLAMWHTLGSWLFAAFVIAHVYLTTTGTTPLANLRAMLWGYEDVPRAASSTIHSSVSESNP